MKITDVIIVGSDHYNTLWLVRSLGIAGYTPLTIIVGSHNKKCFVSKSKYCKKCVFVDTLDDVIDALLSLDLPQKTVVMASGDPVAEVFDRNYNILSRKFFLHNCNNEEGRIIHWMDKRNMLEFAKECGLSIPYTKTFDLNSNCDFTGIPYPCLIKPEVSAESSKNSFRICNNIMELEQAVEAIRDECGHILIQEYVKSDYECLIYGVSTKNEICIPGSLHKLHTCSDFNNLGMMSLSVLSSDFPVQLSGIDYIKNFINGIGYHGVFSVEFMITKEKAYFLEINLRNDGTCYITTQAGVNIPAIWVASAYNQDTKRFSRKFVRKCTFGMNEINYLKYTLKKVGIVQTLKDIAKTHAFSLFKADDIKPFLYKFIYH